MSQYGVTITWRRGEGDADGQRYHRAHLWRFDGGVDVPASASPQVVPLPYSSEAAVDPEEAFVAALASCHMLWFLSIAAESGYRVDAYEDHAAGVLQPDGAGRLAMTEVTLHPEAVFSGARRPTRDQIEAMHEKAHQECFIANSVKTEVRCLPR